MSISKEFIGEILRFADDLPTELIERVAAVLYDAKQQDWSRLRVAVLREIPQQHVHDRTLQFLHYWQTYQPDIKPEAVGLALQTAAKAATQHQAEQSLELVWTGPESRYVTLRRTDQALLQVINEAQDRVHIVSFAVYKAELIVKALVNAAQRGVDIAIYLETPETSSNKMAFDTVEALGEDITKCVRIFVWPLDERPKTPDGRYGSLHAKMALADGSVILISSANLTEYAMSLNMELGVLVRGGTLPEQMEAHLADLVLSGTLKELVD